MHDPYREDLHQAVMEYLIQAERYAEAAAQYRQVCDMLDDEFGLPPSPKTQALFDQMRSLAADVTADIPSPVPLAQDHGPFVCDGRTFESIVALAVRSQARHGEPFAVLKIGLPVAEATAERWATIMGLLRHTLRDSDVVCHDADGDRVLIQLPHTGRHGCAVVRRRIIDVLSYSGLPASTVDAEIWDERTGADVSTMLR